jgi:DNA-binding response OmpR family regulator
VAVLMKVSPFPCYRRSGRMPSPLRFFAVSLFALVEDNADIAETLSMYLSICGHEVRVARDGLEGVELVEAWQPDAAVVDVGLPRLDGFGVARRLRQQPALDRTLLVALTAYGSEEYRQRGLEAGFDSYLVKPVLPGDLLKVLLAGRVPGGTAAGP